MIPVKNIYNKGFVDYIPQQGGIGSKDIYANNLTADEPQSGWHRRLNLITFLAAVAASERERIARGIDRPRLKSIWKICLSDGFPTHPKDRRNTSFCGGIPCNIKFRTANFPGYFSEIFQPVFGVSSKDI